jgi:G:T/U-mismatch repair DNA glycosylase
MPINELEQHPYLQDGEIQYKEKLILGSFPVYACTNPDTNEKRQIRADNGTIRFFYGSSRSSFWYLYSLLVDNQITLPPDPNVILKSLKKKGISITDTILSCERIDYSALDKDLRRKKYNISGIQDLITNGVTKIICTSKGVLDDLQSKILCKRANPFSSLSIEESQQFHNYFIDQLGGNRKINLICRVFIVGNKRIYALALPSPGSPKRKLENFGFLEVNLSREEYAQKYFNNAFKWFLDYE